MLETITNYLFMSCVFLFYLSTKCDYYIILLVHMNILMSDHTLTTFRETAQTMQPPNKSRDQDITNLWQIS